MPYARYCPIPYSVTTVWIVDTRRIATRIPFEAGVLNCGFPFLRKLGVNAESKETACAKGGEKRPTPGKNGEK